VPPNPHRLAMPLLEFIVLVSGLCPVFGLSLDNQTSSVAHGPSDLYHLLYKCLPRCARQASELPYQVVRDLEGGIRIVRIDLGAGLVHPHDERGIALGDLVGDNPGYQFGGAALADDHQAPCN
jgi:hypothetical protein